MPEYEVEVHVALSRPPAVHEIRKVMVGAESAVMAELIAMQIAQAHPEVVMAVAAMIVE